MNRKKTIAMAIVLLLVSLIGGMLAYFTDADTKTNVFTLGDAVDIELIETWKPEDGLNLHPGAKIDKAPSIKNKSTTTAAYVFAEVIVPCYASTGTTVDTPLFTFTENQGWTLIKTSTVDTTNKTITYVYAYGSTSDMTELAKETTTTTPVFDDITLTATLTKEQKSTASATPNIIVNAYGIQAENLGTTTPSVIYDLVNPAD